MEGGQGGDDGNERVGPPRARLIFRVGITGHRPPRLTEHAAGAVREVLRDLLEGIQRAILELPSDIREAYASDSPLLRLVSPLAEGSDRIAAREALKLGYELQCPLPFSREAYARDFASQESKDEFAELTAAASAVFELDGGHDEESAREDGYEAVGRVLLRQCDLLIAVWDGHGARGRGGTGSIVNQAGLAGVPVAWVDSRNPNRLQLRSDTGGWLDFSAEALHERILAILRPPGAESVEKGSPDLREAYFAEREPGFSPLSSLWAAFVRLGGGGGVAPIQLRFHAFADATARDWAREPQGNGAAAAVRQGFDAHLLEHAAWADQLARYYAGQYRSAFLLIYLLATAAVLWAIDDLAYGLSEPWHHARLIVTGCAIIVIVALWAFGTRRHWHSRWIDYRLLAEFLRHQRYLALLGLASKRARKANHQAFGDPGNSWVGWHVRAVGRELGLPNAALDAAYLADARAVLREDWVEGQREYHIATAERHERLERWMRLAGLLTFGAAFAVSFVALFPLLPFSFGERIEGWHWLDAFEIALPALGGGIAAIRSQGELERLAKRSAAMAAGLGHVCEELDRLDIRAEAGVSRELSAAADSAATAMIDEILDWRVVFEARPLELPG